MEEENAWYYEGRRLRRLLRARRETLKQFSDRSTVPYRTLQNHVAGKTSPSAEQLAKFAEAGIDLSFLLTGKGKIGESKELSENEYVFLLDEDLKSEVMNAAFQAIDNYLLSSPKEAASLSFKELLRHFVLIQDKLTTNVLKFEDSIFRAREGGFPADEVLKPIIDLTLQIYAAELRAKTSAA